MWGWIEYLKDPHLVLKVQSFFGVQSVPKNNKHNSSLGNNSPIKSSLTKRCLSKEDSDKKLNGTLKEPKNVCEENVSSESDTESKDWVVTNKFWYYLFVIGTELGDEIFYASFIPFWFWNIDGAVGRRVVMVWSIIMYIGQGLKDVVCWPRPSSPPVHRLHKKWVLEYGMPSTHAMVGVSIPFSVILYTMHRYQYSVPLGFAFAVIWCSVISVSRLYLGMHTVLDVIAGLILALLLMIPVVPLVDYMDIYILTCRWSPVILIVLSIFILVFYPKGSIWTPTRGDTTLVVSVCVGVHIGAWVNYQLGQMSEAQTLPPYNIIWPSYEMIGLGILRTALGFSCIVATRAICKSASYATICLLLRLNSRDLQRSPHTGPSSTKNTVELSYKYITYALLGFNTLYFLPTVFKLLGIERPTFYTEV